jgi:2-hydroxychromene-2-carboxylate isomerase
LVALAETPEIKAQLRARTAEAQQLGIFGAPDFVVNGELFFGQDRLEDAIAWARRT